MDEGCGRFREMIERSVSGGMRADEKKILEEHLRGCPECGGYLDDLNGDDILLRGYASLFDDSVPAIAGSAAAMETAARPSPRRRDFFMKRRTVFAAAAVILVAAAIYLVSIRTSTPIFAMVIEEVGRARNVSYRSTFEVEEMDPFEASNYVSSDGVRRSELPYGNVMLYDHLTGTQLTLNSPSKRATILYRESGEEKGRLFNYLDWIQKMHGKPARYEGREVLSGKETDLFVYDDDPHDVFRVWVDPETDLPVKAVFVTSPNPDSDIISPGLHISSSSFGGTGDTKSISYSASGGITRASTVTMDVFAWNSDLDPSLFDMTPPEGYTVDKDSLDVACNDEKDLLSGLELWTSLTGGLFPGDINDLSDQRLVEPMLIEAYDGDGDPDREMDEAMKAANTLLRCCLYAQEMKVAGTWHYRGKGVKAGDTGAPVCWWKKDDSDTYRIMYGDLRIEDIEEDDLPK